jgi:spore coat protein A
VPTTAEAVRQSVRTRVWDFDRGNGYYQINGKNWDKNRFDANPRLGTTEIWEFVNGHGGWFHPVHVHLVNYQILQRASTSNGGNRWRAPNLWERGRKDTVALGENEKVRVIIKWDAEYYQNYTGPYMIHCHNIDHEDHDMMTQYMLLPKA